MGISLKQLILVLGGWGAILLWLSIWSSKLLTERLLSKWRRDEQKTVEELRGYHAIDQLLLEGAIGNLRSGEGLNHQKRLAAIERLWNSVLRLRDGYSNVVFFFSILTPEEYDSGLQRNDAIAASISGIDHQSTAKAMEFTRETENDRPYLGDTLWFRFFVYRAFLGRLSALVSMGKEKGHISDWKKDDGVRQLLSHGLPPQLLDSILGRDVNSLRKAVDYLESAMLEEMSLVISGKRSAFESFENAKDLRKGLAGAGAG